MSGVDPALERARVLHAAAVTHPQELVVLHLLQPSFGCYPIVAAD